MSQHELISRAQKYTTPFAILKLFVPDCLRMKYTEAVERHNDKMEKNEFPDSGFDLYLQEDFIINNAAATSTVKIDFGVVCEMQNIILLESEFSTFSKSPSNIAETQPTAFYLLPRSSISKKPLMMANSFGLIDSGYRGNIQAVFRYFADENECGNDAVYKIEKYERLVQIVHPTCCRVFVHLVNRLEDLTSTQRNAGGFGSTGM
jgi:dUTPase